MARGDWRYYFRLGRRVSRGQETRGWLPNGPAFSGIACLHPLPYTLPTLHPPLTLFGDGDILVDSKRKLGNHRWCSGFQLMSAHMFGGVYRRMQRGADVNIAGIEEGNVFSS
jgi:hypothetical protein